MGRSISDRMSYRNHYMCSGFHKFLLFSYGKTMVEMTDADLEMCKVETTGKSMSLIGFVDR